MPSPFSNVNLFRLAEHLTPLTIAICDSTLTEWRFTPVPRPRKIEP